MNKVAIFYNKKLKPNTEEIAKNLSVCLEDINIESLLNPDKKFLIKYKEIIFAVSLGGDGCFLDVSNRIAKYSIPIIGVNYGRVGYLCKIEPISEDSHLLALFDIIDDIHNNTLKLEYRTRISASVNGKYIGDALNEITIGGINRTVYLDMLFYINKKKYFFKSIGDGIIFSTMTGSTAYNRSAGGSILFDDSIFSITPNNPSLFESEKIKVNTKSFVTSTDTVFEVGIHNKNKDNIPYLIFDGQHTLKLGKDDIVEIKKSEYVTKFIELLE